MFLYTSILWFMHWRYIVVTTLSLPHESGLVNKAKKMHTCRCSYSVLFSKIYRVAFEKINNNKQQQATSNKIFHTTATNNQQATISYLQDLFMQNSFCYTAIFCSISSRMVNCNYVFVAMFLLLLLIFLLL